MLDVLTSRSDLDRIPASNLERGLGFDQVQDHPIDHLDSDSRRLLERGDQFLPSGPPSTGGDGLRDRNGPFRP